MRTHEHPALHEKPRGRVDLGRIRLLRVDQHGDVRAANAGLLIGEAIDNGEAKIGISEQVRGGQFRKGEPIGNVAGDERQRSLLRQDDVAAPRAYRAGQLLQPFCRGHVAIIIEAIKRL